MKNMRKISTEDFTKEDLEEALRAITSMTSKIEKAQAHFNPGTSQHTLAKNRLKALRLAAAFMTESLEGHGTECREGTQGE
jgi:hypothetical protein